MKLLKIHSEIKELPVKTLLSMQPLFQEIDQYANDKHHPYHKSSKVLLERLKEFPELRTGIKDLSKLSEYGEAIKLLFKPLFPDLLQLNEIKAAALPFNYTIFHPTKRFANILANAGADYELKLNGYNIDKAYIYACSFILGKYYGKPVFNFNRPVYLDIPNQKTGQTHHYRALFNADFLEVIKSDTAPDLTQTDIDELLKNGDNLALWKEKFPPNSYIMKGFGIMNMFDATPDVIISKTRSVFLRTDEQVFPDFQKNLQDLFGIKDLLVGISVYNTCKKRSTIPLFNKTSKSLFMDYEKEMDYRSLFCDGIYSCVLEKAHIHAISDVEFYGKKTNQNIFYKKLKEKNIQSIILVPIKIKGEHLQVIEIASTRKNELNTLNGSILEEIIPFVKIAAERYFEESENLVESTIQENYTSIHPTVKWRFVEAATNFNAQKAKGIENPVLEGIIFEKVYPLYGQSDIKGSSVARNEAIQADLELQLSLVIKTFQKVMKIQKFSIYKNLVFRIENCLANVKKGLKAGDEVGILVFLKKEIYPVFNHVKTLSPELKKTVTQYMAQIDPELKVVYRQRKSYEDSVTLLNDRLAGLLDKREEEAQQMFPHYFERYKTDGVEYNMYIGDSLVNDRKFNKVYLQNLRLWQLETMCQIEQLALDLVAEMPYALRVASLILVHSSPLAIKFRMDEKQFDVDGAYNVRYEIIKKRIDKSHIKGTDERLTQPGKIAIVYSQNSDAAEYLNYIKYLQSQNLLGKVEMLDLEDLQGLSGLQAIRVEVIYQERKDIAVKKKEKSVAEMVAELGIVETAQ